MAEARRHAERRTSDQYTVVLEGLRSDFKVFGEGISAVRENVDDLKPKVDELTRRHRRS